MIKLIVIVAVLVFLGGCSISEVMNDPFKTYEDKEEKPDVPL